MTTKADMIQRQKDLLDQLNSDNFDKTDFMTKHHILDRTLRRDLNALVERGEIFEDKLAYLRKKCLGKLTEKAHNGELSNNLMFNIVMTGIAQKTEITSKSEHVERKEVTFNLDTLDPAERKLFEQLARRYIKTNNKTEPNTIH